MVGENGEQLEFSHAVGENLNWYKLFGKRLSQTFWLSNSFLKYKPSRNANIVHTGAAKSLQSCPTLCDPIGSSPPGPSVPGILQARTLEWVAISSSNAWKWKVKVKSLSHVWLFVTPWIAARQASLFITNSRSSPKPMSIESVMPSSHLILCHPLLLLPPILTSIRVFSNESTLCMRWPNYQLQR